MNCRLLLGIVVCSMTAAAPAIAQSGCEGSVAYYWPAPPAPPGSYDCVSQGPYQGVCKVRVACAPPAAAEENKCSDSAAGRPICLASGNTFIVQADLEVPGLGGGLNLTRTWNSKWPSSQTGFKTGIFGPNWRSTYEERIFVGSDNYIKYLRGDGSFWSFAYASTNPDGTFVYTVTAPANAGMTLVSSTTAWTVTSKSGEKRVFSKTSGSLDSIVDRNGNTTQLTYDAANRLVTVTDPAGRTLTFTYVNPSSYLVSGVSSSVGTSLSYAYDASDRLATVTRPDNTTISFQYDANSLIIAVRDHAGVILESHTYDSLGWGLTSSRAGGVESLTVTYPQ